MILKKSCTRRRERQDKMVQEDAFLNNPLLFAASKGSLDAVYAAIQQGIDINTEDQVSNLTLVLPLILHNPRKKDFFIYIPNQLFSLYNLSILLCRVVDLHSL